MVSLGLQKMFLHHTSEGHLILETVRNGNSSIIANRIKRDALNSINVCSEAHPTLLNEASWPTSVNTESRKGSEEFIELLTCPKPMGVVVYDVEEALQAIDAGMKPSAATGGLGGAYFFKNRRGENIAVVKPTDEEPFAPNNPNGYVGRALGEPGMKKNIPVGEAAIREVAAYLLDHGGFARVPETVLIRVKNSDLNVNEVFGRRKDGSTPPMKIASFQKFVKHDFDASECGTSRLPTSDVHRIGILDIRIFNLDRHSGNILIRNIPEESAVELNPIDHGFSLPESLESPYFEWQHWPQASIPFTKDELDYISHLDPYAEAELLRRELPMLKESSLRILVLSTTLLKLGAKAGLTLSDIAGIMCSEPKNEEHEPSELEKLCLEAKVELEWVVNEKQKSESQRPIGEVEINIPALKDAKYSPDNEDYCLFDGFAFIISNLDGKVEQTPLLSLGSFSELSHDLFCLFDELSFIRQGYSLPSIGDIDHVATLSFEPVAVMAPGMFSSTGSKWNDLGELKEAFPETGGFKFDCLSEKMWRMYMKLFEGVVDRKLTGRQS